VIPLSASAPLTNEEDKFSRNILTTYSLGIYLYLGLGKVHPHVGKEYR
jgi:hypothetical protein